ncbi:malate permease [Vagococcus penaei]|uniref:Malate permease n=1 Tax=Vagococcus penaei TaxID=633807 RepID=A0A1Q2D4X0_9ENTE|nr:AEC family transporter [Vagococcus penaei]AQP53409.1 malate permease [Vagococcus penaei]RST98635.1 malate permease [Vagococcus penaei]
MVFVASTESILSIILIIGLGYLLRRRGWFADSFSGNISKLIMNIALPASIFVSVLKYLTRDKLFALSGGLVYTILSIIIGYLLAYFMVFIFKIPVGRKGVFINAVVNANTIFIGLPLNIALFGENSLPFFLIYYVTNTVSTWAFGALIIAHDNPEKKSGSTKFNLKKLLPPPLIGFLVALVFLLGNLPVPTFINSTLTYVGNMVTPLSLIYIGIILCDAGLRNIRLDRETLLALFGRFILSPVVMIILIFALERYLGQVPIVEAKTLVIQSAGPALAVLPILANEANGDVKYATNIVTTSTVLFMVVVPLLSGLLNMLF